MNTNDNIYNNPVNNDEAASNIIFKENDNDENNHVLICTERLKKLELLENSLPKIIEQAINEHKAAKLRLLHEKDKQNPAAVNLRVKRYNEKNKEKIKAKRNMKKNEIALNNEEKIKKGTSVIDSLNVIQADNTQANTKKTVVTNIITNKDFIITF